MLKKHERPINLVRESKGAQELILKFKIKIEPDKNGLSRMDLDDCTHWLMRALKLKIDNES